MAGNKDSSHLHNHGTCSKSFCGKQGMKLSHGNFWPSHENTFSKKAVNLMVEWVTAHGKGWKSHQQNYSKLNWTIKNVWLRQTALHGQAKQTLCPCMNFSFAFPGQFYMEKYLVPQVWGKWGPVISGLENFSVSLVFRVKSLNGDQNFNATVRARLAPTSRSLENKVSH